MFPKRAQSPVVDAVVSSLEPVTLAGGAVFSDVDLNISLRSAPVLAAADGGANRLLALGRQPVAVIGDMDSLSVAAANAFADCLYPIAEQDSTDFEKAITRIDAPAIVAVGFSGARLDHTLAVYNAMARNAERRIVLLAQDDAAFVMPPQGTLDLPAGTRISLMPLGAAQVTTHGLRWDADDRQFDPAGHTSPSNEATDAPFSYRVQGPVLAIVPRAHLDTAIAAVRGR